jgi:hypothetical protein
MGKIDLRQMERFVDRIGFLGGPYTAADFVANMRGFVESKGSSLSLVLATSNVLEWDFSARRYTFSANGDQFSVYMTPNYDEDEHVHLVTYYIELTNNRTGRKYGDTIPIDGGAMPARITALFNHCFE